METAYFPDWYRAQVGGKPNMATGKVLNPPTLTLIAESGFEPVSLQDLKTWLRIDQAYEDSLITSLGKSARRQVEKYTNRSLVNQTFDCFWDMIPNDRYIEIPHLPLTSIVFVQTYGLDNSVTIQDPSTYQIDQNDNICKIFLNIGNIWNVPVRQYKAFQIRFVSNGYLGVVPSPQLDDNGQQVLDGNGNDVTTADIIANDVFIEAIKLLVDDKYQNRGQVGDPKFAEMSDIVKTMLQPYKLVRL